MRIALRTLTNDGAASGIGQLIDEWTYDPYYERTSRRPHALESWTHGQDAMRKYGVAKGTHRSNQALTDVTDSKKISSLKPDHQWKATRGQYKGRKIIFEYGRSQSMDNFKQKKLEYLKAWRKDCPGEPEPEFIFVKE